MKRDKIFYILALCVLYYALWTLLCHISIVAGITWFHLKISFIVLAPILTYPIHKLSSSLSLIYLNETKDSSLSFEIFSKYSMQLILFFFAIVFIFTSNYTARYITVIISVLSILIIRKQHSSSVLNTNIKSTEDDYIIPLLIIAVATVFLSLCFHRTDLDDCNFLQIASTTINHANMPPFSFEHSMGTHMPHFRFAPYKASSYELFISFISDVFRLNLLHVYYVLIPAASSVLSVFAAFLFARWFSDSKSAIITTAILIIVFMSWGDTHFAYGNRVFVRLFQGKSLLIAICVPIVALSTMMAASLKNKRLYIFTLVSIITCIGVSSNGIIISLVTGAASIIAGITDLSKKTVLRAIKTSGILLYPLLCGLYIKVTSATKISFSELGTVVPVNASFGSSIREAIVLITIIIAVAFISKKAKNRQFTLLSLASIVIVINPFTPKIIAALSAANAEWRMAWAAPIPILFSISITAIIRSHAASLKQRTSLFFTAIGVTLLLLFLFSGKWTLRRDNNVIFGKPGPTIEKEYYQTLSIMKIIHENRTDHVIAALPQIAAWIPLVSENSILILPGHRYPSVMRTIIDTNELEERIRLASITSDNNDFSENNLKDISHFFKKYKVNTLIIKKDNSNANNWILKLKNYNIAAKKTVIIDDFSIVFF